MLKLTVIFFVGFSESVGLRGRLLRKIEALKAEQSGSEVPDEFLCPITRELMKDPVIAAGHTTSSTEKNPPMFVFLHFLYLVLKHPSAPQMDIHMRGTPSKAGSEARTKPVP